jgi:hypothetical protein
MSNPVQGPHWVHTLGMPKNIRLRGLARLLLALLLFPAGALLVLAAAELGLKASALLTAPVLASLALLPWSVHELLLGRNWSEGRPGVRLLLIATVLPLTILPLVGYALR